MNDETKIKVSGGAGRLDKYLAESLPLSRSSIKNAIISGEVTVNGSPAKPGDRLKDGDVVIVRTQQIKEKPVVPEDIPINIVYEDKSFAIINKPQGMVVHPAPGNRTGTLVGALLFRVKDLSGIGGPLRPGIVHRLDKDTSGLIIIAKDDEAHACLSRQIENKTAKRIYDAIVHGNIREESLTVDKSIGRSRHDRKKMAVDASGRDAVTHIRVLERFGQFTYIEASLETGRTHQIRVHLASIGRPIAGDTVYGPKKARLHAGGQLLHAKTLKLCHPETGEEMEFYAPLPEYFARVLRGLRGGQPN
ncbi:MAG: RluA family pseudouridine synthase [Christensenellales bacterium]|jgi:23S rRNA pseudouridine1911/1915/1917 synthase